MTRDELLFRELITSSPDPIVVSSAESGVFLDASRSFLELVGMAREDVIGRSSMELGLVDKHRRGATMQLLREGGGRLDRADFPLRLPDGRQLMTELSATLVHAAEQDLLLMVLRDVTNERAAAEYRATNQAVLELLAGNRGWPEIRGEVAGSIARAMAWDVGLLWEPLDEHLTLSHGWLGPDPSDQLRTFLAECGRLTFAGDESLIGIAWSHRYVEWDADVIDNPRFARAEIARTAGLRSLVCIPVVDDNDTAHGVIELFDHAVRAPDPAQRELLAQLGRWIGMYVARSLQQERIVAAAREREAEYERALRDYRQLLRHRLANPLTVLAGTLDFLRRHPTDVDADVQDQLLSNAEAALDRLRATSAAPHARDEVESAGLDAMPHVGAPLPPR